MSLWSSILGTDGVIDGIKDGIDKSILTPEERLDYHKELLKSYEPFKLIQRTLAFAVSIMFGFVLSITTILFIIGLYYPTYVESAKNFSDLEVVTMVAYSFAGVMSLFFSGGVVDSFKRKAK